MYFCKLPLLAHLFKCAVTTNVKIAMGRESALWCCAVFGAVVVRQRITPNESSVVNLSVDMRNGIFGIKI